MRTYNYQLGVFPEYVRKAFTISRTTIAQMEELQILIAKKYGKKVTLSEIVSELVRQAHQQEFNK